MCKDDFCRDKTHRCATCVKRNKPSTKGVCKQCSTGVKCAYKPGPPEPGKADFGTDVEWREWQEVRP